MIRHPLATPHGSALPPVVLFVGWSIAFFFSTLGQAALQITEFSASGEDTLLLDEDGEAHDWIEIHNPSAEAVDLSGWHLSNDEELLNQWTFPPHLLEPGAFLVVFASGKDRATEDGPHLHTNFRLNLKGEFLALVMPGGKTIAMSFNPYPEQRESVSFGLVNDEGRYFSQPTPGEANDGGVLGFVEPPDFDVARGFHDEPFVLTLSSSTEEARIRYTTDGSEPTVFSGKLYSEPIPIDTTTIIRAVAQKADHAASTLVTHTYVFPAEVLHQANDGSSPPGWPTGRVNGQHLYYQMHPAMAERLGEQALVDALKAIPTLSLVTPLDNLVNSKTGIYVNAENRGLDWERPVSLELLHPSGEEGFEVACGLRIRGGISRGDEHPKHSFRVLFRERYGDAKLRFRLFGDEGELHNPGSVTVSLRGLRLADGVTMTFSDQTQIPAGGYGVLVSDPEAFATRYGDQVSVLGHYNGSLSNDGERIALVRDQQETILELIYNDAAPWPQEPDGMGASLSRILLSPANPNEPEAWESSEIEGGTPGIGSANEPNSTPPPFTIESIHRHETNVTVNWVSVPGRHYRLEHTPDLESNSWTIVTEHTAEVSSSSATDDDPSRITGATGFYRVVATDD